MKDNLLQGCLVSTTAGGKIQLIAFLSLSKVDSLNEGHSLMTVLEDSTWTENLSKKSFKLL